ncbi:hypothetical protein T439DRAFT_375187 [Meredithblackwellia eburnea MCA 4105]
MSTSLLDSPELAFIYEQDQIENVSVIIGTTWLSSYHGGSVNKTGGEPPNESAPEPIWRRNALFLLRPSSIRREFGRMPRVKKVEKEDDDKVDPSQFPQAPPQAQASSPRSTSTGRRPTSTVQSDWRRRGNNVVPPALAGPSTLPPSHPQRDSHQTVKSEVKRAVTPDPYVQTESHSFNLDQNKAEVAKINSKIEEWKKYYQIKIKYEPWREREYIKARNLVLKQLGNIRSRLAEEHLLTMEAGLTERSLLDSAASSQSVQNAGQRTGPVNPGAPHYEQNPTPNVLAPQQYGSLSDQSQTPHSTGFTLGYGETPHPNPYYTQPAPRAPPPQPLQPLPTHTTTIGNITFGHIGEGQDRRTFVFNPETGQYQQYHEIPGLLRPAPERSLAHHQRSSHFRDTVAKLSQSVGRPRRVDQFRERGWIQ